jgi:translation initiation factor IF-2
MAKDFRERLLQTPTPAREVARPVVRREEPPAKPAPEGVTQQRVGGSVVRRRPGNDSAPEAPTTVIRRRPVEVPLDARPVVSDVPKSPFKTPPPPPPPPEPPPVVRAPEPVVAVAHEPPPPVPAEPVAPVAQVRPAEEPPRPQVAEPVPAVPRYSGLGRAVVQPPPGYDPSNPTPRPPDAQRARRRVETTATAYAPPGERGRTARRGSRGDAEAAILARSKALRGRRKPPGPAPAKAATAPKASKRKIRVDGVISVGQLAHELGIKAPAIIRQLMDLGRLVTITEMLDIDTAAIVASEFEYEVENVGFQEGEYLQHVGNDAEADGLQRRPPVVTIMGHVDHGKTTLLDAIRKAKVAQGEAGGITQHIGAYQVTAREQPITFLDTPGHEAFSSMRARGASITDVVVLVVAVDDGVQPQTVEAIAHAKAAGVPIVVAVNKMDRPGANPDTIKQRLSEHELVPEDWGGDTMYVPVSALKKQGIDELLESIILQADVLELRANPTRHAEGAVIEAKMERGRGPVATVLVRKGTLKRGDHVVLGSAFGRVRAMLGHDGAQLVEAGPSTPVELFGLSELPEVGDTVSVVANEKNARTLAEHRAEAKRNAAMAQHRRRTAEDLFAKASEEARKTQYIVLKADVGGTLQAIKASLEKIKVEGTEIRVLHAGVGDISESDVNLAFSNGALLLGFNVNLDARARQSASEQGVEPELHDVIYGLLEKVERRLKGLLEPTWELVRQGTVEVRVLFKIGKVGVIAGSYVQDGKVARSHLVRVMREGTQLWEGRVGSLKRFKEDVREVSAGFECGVGLDGYHDLRVGDLLETFARERVEAE